MKVSYGHHSNILQITEVRKFVNEVEVTYIDPDDIEYCDMFKNEAPFIWLKLSDLVATKF